MTRNIDYGNPRMRANEIDEELYVNALMTQGHAILGILFTEVWHKSRTNWEVIITVNPDEYDISGDYGTTQDPESSNPNFFSRMDDLQGVVFDSLFSRFRAQNLYGELTVIFRGSENYNSRELSRDTF
jgi:hypothetical protein